jgi:hypothetical protein
VSTHAAWARGDELPSGEAAARDPEFLACLDRACSDYHRLCAEIEELIAPVRARLIHEGSLHADGSINLAAPAVVALVAAGKFDAGGKRVNSALVWDNREVSGE